MTGQVAASAAAQGRNYTVTIGNSGNAYGYSSGGGFGALTPNEYGNSGGLVAVTDIYSDIGFADFSINLLPNLAQTWFSHILVLDTAGTWRRYAAADAFFTPGGPTLWKWGFGVSRVWTAVGTGRVIIYPFKKG